MVQGDKAINKKLDGKNGRFKGTVNTKNNNSLILVAETGKGKTSKLLKYKVSPK